MTDSKKDELTELKARITELERAAAPPKPYIDDWVPPPHPIDRVSMSPSTMREFAAAVPTNVVRDIVGDNRGAPTGPASPGPASATPTSSNPGIPGSNTSGWLRETPLSNPPGTNYVDMLCRVDAEKQRGERMIAEARRKAAGEKPE
jgi:hypothetical protein